MLGVDSRLSSKQTTNEPRITLNKSLAKQGYQECPTRGRPVACDFPSSTYRRAPPLLDLPSRSLCVPTSLASSSPAESFSTPCRGKRDLVSVVLAEFVEHVVDPVGERSSLSDGDLVSTR